MVSSYRKPLFYLGLFCWLFFLEAWQFLSAQEKIDPTRQAQLEQVKDFNLGDFVERPGITKPPQYLDLEKTIPARLKSLEEYSKVQAIHRIDQEGDFRKAYVETVRFIKDHPQSELSEWMTYAKPDFLYKAQGDLTSAKYKLVLEDYQDAARRYPLHPELPRALYQIALLHLQTEFNAAVETTVQRALNDYPDSRFAPYLLLLSGEQALRTGDDLKATTRFDDVIRRFPRSGPAVDAAFRKAYLVFNQGNYEEALTTYDQLEKFHSDVFTQLKLEREPSSTNKYLDRIYYAETVFLNDKFSLASELFQGLANIFPQNEYAPLLWIRFGDTYLKRNQPRAALNIYSYIIDEYPNDARAVALAKIRLTDTYYLTKSINSVRRGEKLITEAYESATEAKDEEIASYALAKQILFYLTSELYPKAKEAVRRFRLTFKSGPNVEWVEEQHVKLLELEIMDHYRAGDYLAALTIYLVHEGQKVEFRRPEVLLRLSDAARALSLLEKASEILNRVIYIESDRAGRQEALLRLIEILIFKGEIRKASERLRRFNFAYPRTDFRHLYEMMWGKLYTKLENSKRAVKHFERAINAAKNNPKRLFDIRFAYIHMGDHFNKLALPLRSVESYENFIKLYTEVANSPLDQRILTSKDHYLNKVSHYKIADTYFSMRDFVKALGAYQQVNEKIKEEPFLSHARYRIGECYLALNDRDSALRAFKKVSSEDPDNLWKRAAESYIKSVELEVQNGIRVFN